MTVFNTGNPVPSSDGRDLNDNALTIDDIVNASGVVTNRVGQQLNTLKSLEEAYIMTAINGGIWANGQQFTAYNQFMVFSSTAYKPKFTTPLPFIVGAAPDLNFVEPASTVLLPLELGTIGNPFLFDDLVAFIDTLPDAATYKNDSYVMCFGRTVKNDGAPVMYKITTEAAPAGVSTNWENLIPIDAVGLTATLYGRIVDGKHRTNADYRASPTEIIAHRGFNFLGVEGTLVNYSSAMEFGPDALEGDCQFTSDGELVLWHDDNLDALTSGTGEVKNNTLAQVQAATFNELAGTYLQSRIHIDKVEDLVRFAKEHGVRLYIEIKKFRTSADISLLVDLIVAEKYETMTNLSSFQIEDIVEVRRLNKRINVGWLTTNINSEQELIDFDKLQRLKWGDVLHLDTNLVLFPALVDLVYNAGVGLASWGVQHVVDSNDLLNVGVTRLITDQPITSNILRGLNDVTY